MNTQPRGLTKKESLKIQQITSTAQFILQNQDFFIRDEVSIVIPTRNRCPYSLKEINKNPLVWCIKSLQNQKMVKIEEIIINDDCSDDHTKEVVSFLTKTSKLKIIYLRNPKRLGYSITKNIGVSFTKSKFVALIDDDLIFKELFLFGGLYSLLGLKEKAKIGVIILPCYYRTFQPIFTVSKGSIGQFDFTTSLFKTNFHCFVEEYLNTPIYLEKKYKILRPVEVHITHGSMIVTRDSFHEVGGFPTVKFWKNYYAENFELGYRFNQKGYKVFYNPDPKFAACHLKYGTRGRFKVESNEQNAKLEYLPYTLGEIIRISSVERQTTGARTTLEEFMDMEIGTIFFFLIDKDQTGAVNWLRREYSDFVVKNIVYSQSFCQKKLNFQKRKAIFTKAAKKALGIAHMYFGKNYPRVERFIEKVPSKRI